MKIAVAIWNERISPVFDVARQIILFDVQNGKIVAQRSETLPGNEPAGQVMRMAEIAPDTLICGAVSVSLAGMLEARGIRLISFISGAVEEVMAAYLTGSLPNPAFSMPGCCGRRGRFRHGARRGQYFPALR